MLSNALVFAYAADTESLGRVNRQTVPQQTLFELLVSEMPDSAGFRPIDEDFADFCTWLGVTVDESKNATGISWNRVFADHSGSIDFGYLPLTLTSLSIESNGLQGIVRTLDLPPKLKICHLSCNRFDGELLLDDLPETLKDLTVSRNSFSGSVYLGNLPQSLGTLDLSSNAFSGSIKLNKLPATLRRLSLERNALTGSLELGELPDGMLDIVLNNNYFSGTVDLGHLPKSMLTVWLHENKIVGPLQLLGMPTTLRSLMLHNNLIEQEEIVVDARPYAIVSIEGNNIGKAVDPYGNLFQPFLPQKRRN